MSSGFWQVKVTEQCEKEIRELLRLGKISLAEQVVIRDWIKFVERHGPYNLNDFSEFHFRDHILWRSKKWRGYRSSSFSYSGRIIYQIQENKVTVIVVRVTVDHDYS